MSSGGGNVGQGGEAKAKDPSAAMGGYTQLGAGAMGSAMGAQAGGQQPGTGQGGECKCGLKLSL